MVKVLLINILENDVEVPEAAASCKDLPKVIKWIEKIIIFTLLFIIHCHLCTLAELCNLA